MILKIGNSYSVTEESYEIHENLPLGVYQLTKRLDEEYDLTRTKDLSLPNKLYGDLSIVDKWIKSFNTFDKNLGILLSGLKGSGKTIYAKKFCIDSKRPVILINEPISGENFNRILVPVVDSETDEPILNEDGSPKTSPLFINSHQYLLWLLKNNKVGFLQLLSVYLSELLQNQEFKNKLDKLT
jgi:hypothetical protein